MNHEKDYYKTKIKDFIQAAGIEMNDSTHPPVCRCPDPSHTDTKPTACIYPDNLWCPICHKSWDVFDIAGEVFNLRTFPEQMKEVKRLLGESPSDFTPQPKKEKQEAKIVPVTVEQAKNIFTKEKCLGMSEFLGRKAGEKKGLNLSGEEAMKYGYGHIITNNWAYKNEDGLIELVDVRFEGGPKKKNVVTMYYDGKYMKSKSAPIRIYNRNLIKKYPDYKILIVEGAKSARAAMCLLELGFLPVTWNGGTHKITMADWSCIFSRDVYFWPDDDYPGLKAADIFGNEYGVHVNNWKIIPPYEPARKLKKHGADIVEVLELLSPEEIAKYIEDSEAWEPKKPKRDNNNARSEGGEPPARGNPDPPIKTTNPAAFSDAPFRILGVAEDDFAYFIDQFGRIYTSKLDALSRNKLSRLAPVHYWEDWIGANRLTNDDWFRCQDDLVTVVGSKDFDKENIRGRGAWRDKAGNICFHTGRKTYGTYSNDVIFLRKPKIQVGLEKDPLDFETIRKMQNAAFNLSFETKVDAMRCLGWAVLAPFSGALVWRPQGLLTGPSGAGKSSIEYYMLKQIAIAERMTGADTTAAGYMQQRKGDVGAVNIDESEGDSEKKEKNRADLFSIMRQSTSDDTPKSYKGTSDQKGVSYTSKDMIMFVAIDPEVPSVQDDNRITRINLVLPETGKRKWSDIKKELNKLFSDENCQRLRSLVWKKLKDIIDLSEKISDEIQDYTHKDHRFAISEGTIMAAYLLIWKGLNNPTKEQIQEFVMGTYEVIKPEDARNQAEEMIEFIFQEKVKVYFEHFTEFSIGEIVSILHSGEIESAKDTDVGNMRPITKAEELEFRRAIEIHGIYVQKGLLGIGADHKEVRRILKRSSGYSRILKRHPKCVKTNHNINRNGKNQKCIMFNVLEDFIPF